MGLTIVGVNHRTAPIDLRERFHVPPEEIPRAIDRLLGEETVEECALLSTCNRTECYLWATPTGPGEEAAARLLAERAGLEASRVGRYVYRWRDEEAVLHLFRVAAGLDSMVVGEPQIQGQVEDAYRTAREARPGAVGHVLHRLFQSALAAGGRVRSETAVGEGAASVPAAAVQLVLKVFGSLEGRRALVIGAGEMGEAILQGLLDRGVGEAVVASRTLARSRETAGRLGEDRVRAAPYLDVPEELRGVDVVLTSTSAPHPVVTTEALQAARGGEKRELVIVDIALPRDVEPAVGDLPGVFLYNIDDLQAVVNATEEARQAEGREAENLLREDVEAFQGWLLARQAVPLIREIRRSAEEVRAEAMLEALEGIEGLSEADRERILGASRLVVHKLLHAPTVALRELAGEPGGADHLEIARRLFALDGRARDGARIDEGMDEDDDERG
ncbi:MAG TPA: glutamyl-tRNA reductase [Gemmatimonadota bacterium]|nr:glutamyl-tRNA reductase [Gemmatimonadota bacterium]